MRHTLARTLVFSLLGFTAGAASAATVFYNNDFPDGLIGTASRPSSGAGERETADDFVLSKDSSITGAAFTGLMPANANVNKVVVEIYRVFPADSKDPPSGNVPTRVNSPSDNALASRQSGSDLQYIATPLQNSFTVDNSVVNNISVGAGGEGAVTGQEVRFNVAFSTPFNLPADHYFFVPQVELADGNFLWLSAPKPVTGPGTTPFPMGATDLQSWIRNDPGIAPDWLRVGQDVVGGTGRFNGSFEVFGNQVSVNPLPETSTYAMLAIGLGFVGLWAARKRRSD